MGRLPRQKPTHLGVKLLTIRQRLGYSQTQMCKALELGINYSAISIGILAKRAYLNNIGNDGSLVPNS